MKKETDKISKKNPEFTSGNRGINEFQMLFPKEKMHNLALWDQYALKNENSKKSKQEN